jgi:hypothetical protein
MTDTYSILLALSAAALGGSWLLLLTERRRPALAPASAVAAAAALLLDAGSLVVHWSHGHQPGTTDAMTVRQFLGEHPAFLIIAIGSVAALGFAAKGSQLARRAA